MTQTSTDITIPLSPETVAVIGSLLLLLIASYLVFRAMPSDAAKPKSWRQRFEDGWGLRIKDPLAAALLVVVLFGYAMIFLFALLISLRLMVQLLFGLDLDLPAAADPNASENPASPGLPFGLAALLAAILGAPFIIWRSQVAAKQAAIAEEALFNDKINAAASDLAARRQVTRILNEGEPTETILTEWKDDLVTRAAAIDRLEGLAKERADIAPRIARMLSTYVQELSREHPAEEPPNGASPVELKDWATGLSAKKRPDMERAVQSLGRINPSNKEARKSFDPQNIDLRGCNLQGFDLSGLEYSGMRAGRSRFEGSVLFDTNLAGASAELANFGGADVIGCDARGADFAQCDLSAASLYATDFSCARLIGANLALTKLAGADFTGADLRHIKTGPAAAPKNGNFTGAAIMGFEALQILRGRWNDVMAAGFSSQQAAFPGEEFPKHWVLDEFYTDDFHDQWRTWAATLDPPVTIAPDYRRD